MKKFYFEVVEITSKVIGIEAETAEDAKVKATLAYTTGNIDMTLDVDVDYKINTL